MNGNRMTNEEAAAILESEAEYLYSQDEPYNRQAFNMAIEALRNQKIGRIEHGREVYREYMGDAIISRVFENWRCGECKTLLAEQASKVVCNYCPHCGVKFDDKEENENDERRSRQAT